MGDKIATQGGEMDDDESGRERFFTVGEVVELWEGAFGRGYRQAPGVPAFVKRVEGNGLYSIKMVGSNRGKFSTERHRDRGKKYFKETGNGVKKDRERSKCKAQETARGDARRRGEKARRGK